MLRKAAILNLVRATADEPDALRTTLRRALHDPAPMAVDDLAAEVRRAFKRDRFTVADVLDAADRRPDLAAALRAERALGAVALRRYLVACDAVRQHTWCRFSVLDADAAAPGAPLQRLVDRAAQERWAGPCAHGRALRAVVECAAQDGDRSRREVAELCGLDDDTLQNRLVLADLVPEVADAVDSGSVSVSVASLGRFAAFFEWRAGAGRVALLPSAQRHVLEGLRVAYPGRCARGATARRVGAKLRDQALVQHGAAS